MRTSPDLTFRSNEPELMDTYNVNSAALETVLADINRVNKILGGSKISKKAVAYLFKKSPKPQYTLVDVGCGDGSMLREIAGMSKKMNISVKLIGIDINPKSIALAQQKSWQYPEIRFMEQDILKCPKSVLHCDVLLCTLTMHHFSEDEIPVFLEKFAQLASIGVVINDLHRSILSYALFKLFSAIFIYTPIAKHDGLISIKKGFKRKELLRYAKDLQNVQHTIQWRWAFRFLWVMHTKELVK